MARPVLKLVCTGLAALLIAAASYGQRSQPKTCSAAPLDRVAASSRKEVREFDQHVRGGPFYLDLVRRFGPPANCDAAVNDAGIRLSYIFGHGARLDAKRNSTAEYSEQRLVTEGLDRKAALALLRRAEKDAFGAGGCGIGWQRPAEQAAGEQAGWRQEIYRGDTCNCQGRILYRGDAVAGLVLSSAC